MATNEIDHAVLSLANPWLEFMESSNESSSWANKLNQDLEQMCVDHEGKLSGFGVLPMHSAAQCTNEIENISRMPHMKGVIVGTAGFGQGLDDPALDPVWEKVQEKNMVVFVHPHYGVGGKQFDGFGHSLHLALGFPFETTTAICRLVISGVLERFPRLKLLLAHSGGTIPFLAGRLDSCVMHDKVVANKLPHAPTYYLKKIYYDALSYHEPAVACTTKFVGADQMMFGTDNPFSISDPPQNYRALGFLEQSSKDLICHETARDLLQILTPVRRG
jgi:aminocarboxymuconate-semialdehyde decarboxylase